MFVAVLIANFAIAGVFFVHLQKYAQMDEAIEATGDCMAKSNLWVPMNYRGKPTEPMVRNISTYVEEGHRVVLFKHAGNYDLHIKAGESGYPVIDESENYIVFGDEGRCRQEYTADRSFLVREGKLNGIEGCKDMFPDFICVFSPPVA